MFECCFVHHSAGRMGTPCGKLFILFCFSLSLNLSLTIFYLLACVCVIFLISSSFLNIILYEYTYCNLSQKIFFGFIFFFLTWQVLSPGSNKKEEKLFTFNFLKEKEQQLFFHFVRKMNNLSANKNVLLFSVLHI